jgi:DNA-binding transcriptional MocR family regulator
MNLSFSEVQYDLRSGIVEFRAGHPDLALLPADGLLQATQIVLEREAPQALSYGAGQGPGCLIKQLSAWLERMEGEKPPSKQVMITGGASQALDMLCLLLTKSADIALVQSPTYHLALRVLRDHQLELVSIPGDEEGMRIDALQETIESLQHRDKQPRLLYLVSTFSNPSGTTLNVKRRKALAELVRQYDLIVVEDDVYYQLWYDTSPPPPIYSLSASESVIRLGSFSKILAPGLRLGWMHASPKIVQRCVRSGVLDSGGGLGHFTAHVVAAFIELGLLDEHVETLRTQYQKRRDVLVDALADHLPRNCHWITPQGGFFVWLRLPEGISSAVFLQSAEDAGVSYVPGTEFFAHGGGENYCRLNFTMVSLNELEEGAHRLGSALRKFKPQIQNIDAGF